MLSSNSLILLKTPLNVQNPYIYSLLTKLKPLTPQADLAASHLLGNAWVYPRTLRNISPTATKTIASSLAPLTTNAIPTNIIPYHSTQQWAPPKDAAVHHFPTSQWKTLYYPLSNPIYTLSTLTYPGILAALYSHNPPHNS